MAETVKDEIDKVFNPEFLNRLDDVIVFHPLTRSISRQIVGILLREVQRRLGDEVSLTPGRDRFPGRAGYDENYGARPLKRAIQRYIEDPLSEKILTGDFGRGDEIEVDVAPEGDKLTFRALHGHQGVTQAGSAPHGSERRPRCLRTLHALRCLLASRSRRSRSTAPARPPRSRSAVRSTASWSRATAG